MKIAYGIHGYGRGHSSRALAVLPEIVRRHELLIFAGGDAYNALHGGYRVVRIPTIKYQLAKNGRRSKTRTLIRAAPCLIDLKLGGPALDMVSNAMAEFAPDVVVSDSEAWTLHAARRLGIGRISFDHYGVLAWCDWPMSARERLVSRFEAMTYRLLMAGAADRIAIASFYDAPPRQEGVCVVGPVLREIVRQVEPQRGDYLLVYFSNGHVHFTSRVEDALRALDVPVVVYGTGREGREGNLDFRPPSNTRFVEDLARCRAIFATAGNQLISEAMHLKKPMLLLPEDSLEQRLNASAIERMGVGGRTSRAQVCAGRLRAFLDDGPRFIENFPDSAGDGRKQAIEAIERFAAELAGRS